VNDFQEHLLIQSKGVGYSKRQTNKAGKQIIFVI
jgi:hypothetical protein